MLVDLEALLAFVAGNQRNPHKLAEIDDPIKREEFLKALAHGSAAAWGHINLLGEYDFSEDKLKDSVGIKPPKLTD